MRVVVRCRATLYERDGAFQVYVNAMFPDGIGAAQLALEQLKRKLEQEGLFDLDRKKPLPAYPRCIGLVTSKTGAALQDIRNVVSRRWPAAKLLLCPVSVQGFEAAQQVAQAIQTLDQSGRADVIIVARGGGSREDLWVFNAECIARAAFQCHTPLISAIGHEIDVTILDFVADCRAPTPSAAAELAVPDRVQLSLRLQGYAQTLRQQMEACKADCADRLEDAAEMLAAYGPGQRLAQSKEKLQEIKGCGGRCPPASGEKPGVFGTCCRFGRVLGPLSGTGARLCDGRASRRKESVRCRSLHQEMRYPAAGSRAYGPLYRNSSGGTR